MSSRIPVVCALAGLLLLAAGPALAQTKAPEAPPTAQKISPMGVRVDQAARALAENPKLHRRNFTHEQR